MCLNANAIVTAGDPIMTSSKMPRRFWSYTAGKGSIRTEEIEVARERKIQELRQTLPGLLAFGGVLLLALIILWMMLAEFRGFEWYQFKQILTPG
jgi:hypothetical protein